MIQLLRVDHRLLHGQVAALGSRAWLQLHFLAAIRSPTTWWKTTLKMGKLAGCKLVIKDMANAIVRPLTRV